MNSLNAAIISGQVVSRLSRKTTNANGWTKCDFKLSSPTKMGNVEILCVCFGNIADEALNQLSEGVWIVASGTLEGSAPIGSSVTFALILKSFYVVQVIEEPSLTQ